MERIPRQESFFDKVCMEMGERGFEFVAHENLGRNKFDAESIKFVPTAEQTVDDIQKKYSDNGQFAVEVVLVPNTKIEEMIKKGIVDEAEALSFSVPEAEKAYLVFRKQI